MTADRTAGAEHIDCPFRALQSEWEERKKEKPLASALYSWCQDEVFGDRLVEACRAHVENETWCEHGGHLIETWDKDNPENALQGLLDRRDGPDVSEHELLMVWAHLRITKAWVEKGRCVPDQILKSLLSDVSEERLSIPFGPSFFRALTRFLSPELSVKNQSDTRSSCSEASALFPLVLDRSDEIRIGRIHAHPSGRGSGRVFLHPEQAFLRLDDDFRAAFDSAQALVGGLSSDVHVRINPLGGRWESPVLAGKSVGGALYLSLKSVEEEEDVGRGTVTSFALSSGDHSPDGQCHPVERLKAKAAGLSSYEGCDRFLISESQKEMLDKHQPGLEVLCARTLEKAWEHAISRLAELRRYLKHVEAEAKKTALHMDRRPPHVRVQAQPTGSLQDTIEELELGRRDYVVSDSEIERGVILGDPGMGKTRLLKEEAKALAQEGLDHLSGGGLPDEVRIPIRLRFSDVAKVIADKGCSLRKAVVEQFKSKEIRSAKTGSATPPSELLANLVEEKVGTDKVWILLDALDEVESDLRGEAIHKVIDFIDTNPNSRLLLTSRPVPYDNGLTRKLDQNKTERELKLQRFEKDQVEEFAEEYFESKEADEFLSRLNGFHALQKMTEVPLFLSFLCMIYEEEGLSDFHGRAEVCREILKEMLSAGGYKPQKHGLSSPMERDRRLDELSAMAFSLKAQGKSEFTPKGLREAIGFGYRKVYSQKPRPEDVSKRRKKYVDELGILSGSDQKYRFVHLTIQDYLSAKWIKKEIKDRSKNLNTKIEYKEEIKRRASTLMKPTNSGPEHVAFLAEMIDDVDPLLKLISKQLESGTRDEQEAAAKTLGQIGNFNSLALEGLVSRLGAENWSTRRTATMALGEIDSSDQLEFQVGETSVRDALVDKLGDTRWSVREAAAKVIGKIEHSEKATRPLCDCLADDKWPVRRAAAKALGKIETSSPRAIENLIDCLGDEKKSVQEEARKSLELLKEVAPEEVQQAITEGIPASRSAAAFITSLLGDERKGFLSAAARALRQTEAPVPETVAKDLARRLGGESEGARNLAAQGLTEIVTTAPEAMGTLGLESAEAFRDRLGDETPVSVRRAVALAIAQIRGPELNEAQDAKVIQGLISCLDEFNLRPEAVKALGRASAIDTEVSEELTQWLAEDERPDTRATVAETLGRIGVFSSQVVEGLVERLEDESANVIKKASRSLQKVESLSGLTIDDLTSFLGNKNKDTRTAAADVLWAAGKKGKMALTLQLNSTSLRARRTAERRLKKGTVDEKKFLTRWLESGGTDALEFAVQVPNKLVRVLSESLVTKVLIHILKNGDAKAQKAAVQMIREIEISDLEGVSILVSHAEDYFHGEKGFSASASVPTLKSAAAAREALSRVGASDQKKITDLLAKRLCSGESADLLIKFLENKGDVPVRIAASFYDCLQNRDIRSRKVAIRTLSETGFPDSQVVTALLTEGLQVEHRYVRREAAKGLAATKPRVSNRRTVDALTDLLEGERGHVERRARQALRQIEICDPEIVQSLLDRLTGREKALARIKGCHPEEVQSLLDQHTSRKYTYEHHSLSEKKAALLALKGTSVCHTEVVKTLIPLLRNREFFDATAGVLKGVDVYLSPLLEIFMDLLNKRSSPLERKVAACAFASTFGKKDPSRNLKAVGALVCRLEDRHPEVRSAVLNALRKVSEVDLKDWLMSKHPFVQKVVKRALTREDALSPKDFGLSPTEKGSEEVETSGSD